MGSLRSSVSVCMKDDWPSSSCDFLWYDMWARWRLCGPSCQPASPGMEGARRSPDDNTTTTTYYREYMHLTLHISAPLAFACVPGKLNARWTTTTILSPCMQRVMLPLNHATTYVFSNTTFCRSKLVLEEIMHWSERTKCTSCIALLDLPWNFVPCIVNCDLYIRRSTHGSMSMFLSDFFPAADQLSVVNHYYWCSLLVIGRSAGQSAFVTTVSPCWPLYVYSYLLLPS
jgi:hypothetical protein